MMLERWILEQVYTWSRRWLQSAVDFALRSGGPRIGIPANIAIECSNSLTEVQARILVGEKGGEAERTHPPNSIWPRQIFGSRGEQSRGPGSGESHARQNQRRTNRGVSI